IIASTEARSMWTRFKSLGDESFESPVEVAIFPSRLMAALRMTNGRALALTRNKAGKKAQVMIVSPKRWMKNRGGLASVLFRVSLVMLSQFQGLSNLFL